ncbi:hypothetical protein LQ564_03880 [Massilia sp. G4R7]|uniref:DUF4345 domain-containing protein n=1 Tax=Massilia phyllostachyos TaxID=2898585 RepID=A0ABS8Q115_9BURK|nr:hypothetical protein [Massilia phyllostachyos]MCD2515449.1 hypothetical protein [Massilia phyllostachyos]
MNQSVHLAALLLRLTLGALSLALGFLTLAALASGPFALALMAQGLPLPLSWPAVLAEFGSALVFLGLHAPRPRRVAGRARAGLVSECQT